jgi:hypothetical protein
VFVFVEKQVMFKEFGERFSRNMMIFIETRDIKTQATV